MKHFFTLTGKFIAIFCLASFVLTFTACKKNEENLYLHNKQDATQTAFADEVKTKGFTFTAKNSWVVFVYEVTTSKGNDVSWINLFCNEKVAVDGRAGTFTIDVALETNYTGQTRTATIEIASGSDKIFVTVTQIGKSKDGETPEQKPIVFDLSNAVPDSVEIATIEVYCNREFLLVAADVAQTGYKITLPDPEKMPVSLQSITEISSHFIYSNLKTKCAIMGDRLWAFNNLGDLTGWFWLSSEQGGQITYIYVDGDCNVTGEYNMYQAACYFKKGWNVYYTYWINQNGVLKQIMTTEKLFNENYEWKSHLWWY